MCVCCLELLRELDQGWYKEKRAIFITGLIICCRLYDNFVQACAQEGEGTWPANDCPTCVNRHLLVRAAICALSSCSCSVVLVFSTLAIHSKPLSYIIPLSAHAWQVTQGEQGRFLGWARHETALNDIAAGSLAL